MLRHVRPPGMQPASAPPWLSAYDLACHSKYCKAAWLKSFRHARGGVLVLVCQPANLGHTSLTVAGAPIGDEEHLLFSCESIKDIRLRFAVLPMSSLRDLMLCEDVGSGAWFVHECMERVDDNSHTG
jgi:hypothetical protein